MTTDIFLVLVSICLSLYGSYRYIYDTFRGTTRPNRVSQGLWAIAPMIGVGAALASGAGVLVTIRTFMAGLVPLIILIASFISKNGYWKTTKFDYVCGAFSLVAMFLWLVADLPVQAILFAVLADLLAAIPTIKKSWTNPESETGITYVTSFFSVVVIIPTIEVYNIQNTAFQLYILLVCAVLATLIYRKKIFGGG